MAGEVFGAEQFQVEWTAPVEVDHVDIYTYDDQGNARVVTKLYPKNPPPPPPPTKAEEYTANQKSVVFVQHESGVTRVLPLKEGI